MPKITLREQAIAGSDRVSISVAISERELSFRYRPPTPGKDALNIHVAVGTGREIGAAVLPFARHAEGSTVFLPFKADLLLSAEIRGDEIVALIRRWERWRWSERERTQSFSVSGQDGEFAFSIPRALVGDATTINFAIYAKDPNANDGWGWFWGCSDHTVDSGIGDKYIPHHHELRLEPVIPSESPALSEAEWVEGPRGTSSAPQRGPSTSLRFAQDDREALAHTAVDPAPLLTRRGRHGSGSERIRIYQLFVRLFGNTNETRKQNGTLAENGAGRFADINGAALGSIRQMGFTHVWLTGVLQQATATDYSEFGRPADDTDLLKGLAGSPYAIKDYFDVCLDYAREPANRLKEFRQLLERLHAHELKAIIDLVPNHVARSCDSCIKPERNFGSCGCDGAGDDTTKFFDPQNNFFYLTPDANGPPLRLPTCEDGVPLSPTCQVPGAKCDGLFEGEKTFGRVTGNNVVSWTPHLNDWYETVKLNYGFDFTDPAKSVREYPNAWAPEKAIPDTWKKMDQVIEHWQSMGVDGFRCDMAHMVPPEFWSWAIAQARRRQPDVFFMGEAYDDDPSKVPGSDPVIAGLNWGKGNVMFDLLNAGFDAVYDAPVYRALKRIYDGSGWANDIDREIAGDFICQNSVRYAENHDEVRLAAPSEWGSVGRDVGRPVCAILYGMSRGAIMLYSGQEVGEPAAGAEGFGGDDARTSIFDYWSMPELAKWVNGHRYDGRRLCPEQKALRAYYGRLINLVGEPAFRDGEFFPLNPANHDNPSFGRLPGEQASGHWLYAFLRYDISTGQRFLIVVNLHPTEALPDVRVMLSPEAMKFLDLDLNRPEAPLKFIDRLATAGAMEIGNYVGETLRTGLPIARIPPLTALYLEFG
ncbi:MAG TPA: alpha-amylase family glycosyl hydrolase [Chthoniobacterales bacterium]|nr:alpha-amylase family glycosyl hydrolase [Chthoniobacterales bacterium]